jgi:hypothetical protein
MTASPFFPFITLGDSETVVMIPLGSSSDMVTKMFVHRKSKSKNRWGKKEKKKKKKKKNQSRQRTEKQRAHIPQQINTMRQAICSLPSIPQLRGVDNSRY